MKAEEILQKVKLAFEEMINGPAPAPTPAPTPVAMMKATLKDGTEVEVDKLEVGGVVTIAGNPAPVGEHYLADGTKIVLGDNGVIMEIEAMEMPPAPAVDMAAINSQFAAIDDRIKAHQAATTAILKDVLALAEILAKQPVAQPDPITKVPNRFSVDENFANAIVSKK